MKKILTVFLLVLFLLLLIFIGEGEKLSVKASNNKTGEVLSFVNIAKEEGHLGNVTGVDGCYFIVKTKPDVYHTEYHTIKVQTSSFGIIFFFLVSLSIFRYSQRSAFPNQIEVTEGINLKKHFSTN